MYNYDDLIIIWVASLLYFSFIGTFLLIIFYEYYNDYKKINFGENKKQSLIKYMNNKGNIGEINATNELNKIKKYKIIMNNLYIPWGDGNTSEIDILLICEYGLYVIESKNYSYWIFGNEKDSTWIQQHFNYKWNFANPIIQNNHHILSLRNILSEKFDKVKYINSVIVFSDNCTLKYLKYDKNNTTILKCEDLYNYMHMDMNNKNKILSINEINQIALELKKYTNVSNDIKQKHIQNINRRLENQNF